MFIRANIPAFIWTLVIFGLCSMPGKAIPHISWLELLSFDKFVHASIFFTLEILYLRGFLIQSQFSSLQKYRYLIVTFLCIAYGGMLEIMQYHFFSQRSGDWFDFIANSFGCLVGAALFGWLSSRIRFFRA